MSIVKKLLLISNSTNAGEAYLDYPKTEIKKFLNTHQVTQVLFIPYAAVTFSYNTYLAKVSERFTEIGIQVKGIHQCANPIDAVEQAEAIVVGGGNTFQLLKTLQDQNLVSAIAQKVANGLPYIGWSAGANLACPTICTTNDMPIVEPNGFAAFNQVTFQINPHFIDVHPVGHAGETRTQRIEEFLTANQKVDVLGLPEGTMLKLENGKLELIGQKPVTHFKFGHDPKEYTAASNLQFLIN